MEFRHTGTATCFLCAVLLAGTAIANVFNMPSEQKSLEFVTVGDPGNAADTRPMLWEGASNGRGAVNYTYKMGKCDVTAAQYCQFLNAVAATDTYNLYNPRMYVAEATHPYVFVCGIMRSGDAGSYTYSVVPGLEDYPVDYVSWGDAARFCNWLSNGQPVGEQGSGTTEMGSYLLNGATTDDALLGISRNPRATYVIPSEHEWYKAAYYKGGSNDAGYWLFPTCSDDTPSYYRTPYGTNNANYFGPDLTPVGFFAGSPGPYGTFDQGGDVFQWTEGLAEDIARGWRGMRGGTFRSESSYPVWLRADAPSGHWPTYEDDYVGFRVAAVPEPASIALLAAGGLLIVSRRRAA